MTESTIEKPLPSEALSGGHGDAPVLEAVAPHQQLAILIGVNACFASGMQIAEVVRAYVASTSDEVIYERWQRAERLVSYSQASPQAALQETRLFSTEVNGILRVVSDPMKAVAAAIEYLKAVIPR
ncbi:hypothetical protein H8F21_13895 [Pseudomonas sp. P66]|uniref:Uncharacterized protein n=1 Tax=Pseudomonas arcuscaelestis TaxID=2710591 RepID=A0ABS2BYG1_9PSED|nr:hypothetical protein [Pseudomonas arcuscaelestis]MBM5458658.1 hypothetical protein [Pseudomonas arcuscaelestis]